MIIIIIPYKIVLKKTDKQNEMYKKKTNEHPVKVEPNEQISFQLA